MMILNFLCPRLFLSVRQLANSETAAVRFANGRTADMANWLADT
jgi:hypothetical protein